MSQKKVKSSKFRGKKYKIKWQKVRSKEPAWGNCDAPVVKAKSITIDPSLPAKEELRICIHEALHACMWDLGEETVHETSEDISHFLWRCGWQLTNG